MATEPKAKQINLALQGGGAHGAFTWGVLDRILADDRIEIAAISGTSAGALLTDADAERLLEDMLDQCAFSEKARRAWLDLPRAAF